MASSNWGWGGGANFLDKNLLKRHLWNIFYVTANMTLTNLACPSGVARVGAALINISLAEISRVANGTSAGEVQSGAIFLRDHAATTGGTILAK